MSELFRKRNKISIFDKRPSLSLNEEVSPNLCYNSINELNKDIDRVSKTVSDISIKNSQKYFKGISSLINLPNASQEKIPVSNIEKKETIIIPFGNNSDNLNDENKEHNNDYEPDSDSEYFFPSVNELSQSYNDDSFISSESTYENDETTYIHTETYSNDVNDENQEGSDVCEFYQEANSQNQSSNENFVEIETLIERNEKIIISFENDSNIISKDEPEEENYTGTISESDDSSQEINSQNEINNEKFLPIESVVERNEIIVIHLKSDSNINDNTY